MADAVVLASPVESLPDVVSESDVVVAVVEAPRVDDVPVGSSG